MRRETGKGSGPGGRPRIGTRQSKGLRYCRPFFKREKEAESERAHAEAGMDSSSWRISHSLACLCCGVVVGHCLEVLIHESEQNGRDRERDVLHSHGLRRCQTSDFLSSIQVRLIRGNHGRDDGEIGPGEVTQVWRDGLRLVLQFNVGCKEHACDAMRVWYCHAIARGICVRHPSDIQTDSHREDRQSQAELSLSLAGSLPRCRNPTLPHSAPHTRACRQPAPPVGCPQCRNPTVIIKQSNNVTYCARTVTAAK